MKKKTIEIVDTNNDWYKVKFPFLKVPVKMDRHFFENHLNNQAFQIVNRDKNHYE